MHLFISVDPPPHLYLSMRSRQTQRGKREQTKTMEAISVDGSELAVFVRLCWRVMASFFIPGGTVGCHWPDVFLLSRSDIKARFFSWTTD